MRRAICYCEPPIAHAGQVGNWKFIYQSAQDLPKGTLLKFDLQSPGREIDWEGPRAGLRRTSNVIYGLDEEGNVVMAEEVDDPNSTIPQFEFELPSDLKEEGIFTIVMGAPQKGKQAPDGKKGNRAQTVVQRRRQFHLYVDPTGKGEYGESEVFSLDVKGNVLDKIRLLAPSQVVKNKRFDVTIRFEDQFGNLTGMAPEETLVDLSYSNLRETLNWKLFVPETGFVILPNLYFYEAGVYRMRLENLHTKQVFISAPIKCFPNAAPALFWGLLHGESDRVDSTENIENCLRHFRDELAWNFAGTSSFENDEETTSEIWKLIVANVMAFNEEDRFSTFLGFQWSGEKKKEGIRQLLFSKDGKGILRSKDGKYNTLTKIYSSTPSRELMSIPCFTMGSGFSYNFDEFQPEFERVVEIYNAWGSSECIEKEGNPRPIKSNGKKGIKETKEGSIREALRRNCRFGFVAGGLDDRGAYAEFFDSDQEQYSPGLTAIVSEKHTREALWEALHRRSCFATTGEEIIIGIDLAGQGMGSELSAAQKPGLAVNRHFSIYVAGTAPLAKIEILRNGKLLHTESTDDESIEFTYDDMESLDKTALPGGGEKPPFVFYYLRVIQANGHIAWSSPIWVDL